MSDKQSNSCNPLKNSNYYSRAQKSLEAEKNFYKLNHQNYRSLELLGKGGSE